MLSGSLETFPNFVRMTLVNPNALSTLDLSFNTFTEIPIVRIQNFYFNISIIKFILFRLLHNFHHLNIFIFIKIFLLKYPKFKNYFH